MTEDELKKLHESCCVDGDFDFIKYHEVIESYKGAWFSYNNQERNDTYDRAMINYMKKSGFIVYDDPFGKDWDFTGWVVFPPQR